MFGHDDKQNDDEHKDEDKKEDNKDSKPGENHDSEAGSLVTPSDDHSDSSDGPAITDQPWQGADEAENKPDLKEALSPAGGYPKPPSQKVHTFSLSSDDSHSDDSHSSDNPLGQDQGELASIKIQALDELYPLIDKLDLKPDERFKTIMMMMQASDNKDLVKAAYDAAHQIEDEKAKAQALLDIVNEINYFTKSPAL